MDYEGILNVFNFDLTKIELGLCEKNEGFDARGQTGSVCLEHMANVNNTMSL